MDRPSDRAIRPLMVRAEICATEPPEVRAESLATVPAIIRSFVRIADDAMLPAMTGSAHGPKMAIPHGYASISALYAR